MTRRPRPRSASASAARAPRIRGFCPGREADITARLPALAVFTGSDPESLRAALRAMRKARLQTPHAYDAVRHAALLRLLKQTAPSGGTTPHATFKPSKRNR
ncbi:MAG: hypothetical protein AB1592_05920 [Pseudomonadota bacterium]